MPPPKRKARMERGKSLGAALGGAAIRSLPGGQLAMAAVGALRPGGAKAPGTGKKRRSRSMFMRKGRVFMGYTQKEVKQAMRRTYGGGKRKK